MATGKREGWNATEGNMEGWMSVATDDREGWMSRAKQQMMRLTGG